jgi:hypothetical protein
MTITTEISVVGTSASFVISTSESQLRGPRGLQGEPGVIPLVTLTELTTTHLAADNFPAMAYCTDLSVSDYVKSTGTQWKKFDGTVVSTDPGSIVPTNVFRFSSPTNRYLNFPYTPNASYVMTNCSRYEHRIGSGDQFELGARASNNYLWLGDVESPGNTLTVVNLFMEVPGKTSQRVTFSGANGTTLTDGAFDIPFDPILPSAFGLTEFPIGMQYFIRAEATIPAGGRLCTVDTWDTDNIAGHVFDNTVVQCTNIGGSGDLLYTGSVTFASQSWTPIMVGKFVSGDPVVALCAGDSVPNGVGDTPSGMGRGFFGRSLIGSSWATALAGCNATRSSGNAQAWGAAPALVALCKYSNVLVEEYGTNNFPSGPNPDPSSVGYIAGLSQNIWTIAKANASTASGTTPYRVFRTKLLPRTNPPTGTGISDQAIYGGAWDSGGNVDLFNTAMSAGVGVDKFISFDAIVRAAEPNQHFWLSGLNSSVDGTHPIDHADMGAELRLSYAE